MEVLSLAEQSVPFDVGISLVNSPKPTYVKEYFTGHLFPRLHLDKLDAFYASVETPLDVLRDDRRREGLLEILRTFKQQKTFFSVNGELNELSSELLHQAHLYQTFSQTVKDKKRNFDVPQGAFKYFLSEYVLPFVLSYKVHSSCHGGEKEWSVEKSLTTHLPVKSSLCFDMEHAFEQCEINHVFDFFYENLERFAESSRVDAAGFLSALCTVRGYEEKQISSPVTIFMDERPHTVFNGGNKIVDAVLPQGSLVSMALFNRIMYPIDEALSRFSRKKGLHYSRWVDDFVISSPKRKCFDHFARALHLAQHHFSIAPHKVFFSYNGYSYLLGHRIHFNELEKINREEFKQKRGDPLPLHYLESTHPHGQYIYMDDFDWEDENRNERDIIF